MKERRLIATAREVRGMLDGTITQVRRVIKPQPDWIRPASGDDGIAHGYCGSGPTDGIACPFGVAGDRLWVAEEWRRPNGAPDGWVDFHADEVRGGFAWEPAEDMPRNLSRITLGVVKVRAEELQDIGEADAEAAGCERTFSGDGTAYGAALTTAVERFAQLWQSMHGPDSWAANPWVWAVEFRRVTQ